MILDGAKMTDYEKYGFKGKLDDIAKKYPFIYDVNGEYYCMGAYVFELCQNRSGVDYFVHYRQVIKKIGRENLYKNHEIDRDDEESLIYYFRKVLFYADSIEDKPETRVPLLEFLNGLDNRVQDSLIEQLEDFVNTFWYYYKRMR